MDARSLLDPQRQATLAALVASASVVHAVTPPPPKPSPTPAPMPDPAPSPSPSPSPTPAPSPSPAPAPAPSVDQERIAAARLLEQATFGPRPEDIEDVRQLGDAAWIERQLALPATPIQANADRHQFMHGWYLAMATAPDQLRQRMVFALSQIFVVSNDKNTRGEEMVPWLQTLSRHAFGNFGALLREMTLNPAMGKYLDLANSLMPAPNENYAREVMQLFTIGLHMLDQDGTVQRDAQGQPIPTYDQARIADVAKALSGWTYAGAPDRVNNPNFGAPLQPVDRLHNREAKTLLLGRRLPAGQSTLQDFEAVMDNLFTHPNVPPFIALRLIRHFVTSNPSPAYVRRVADVFAGNAGGARGDLAATLRAVLLDPEARDDAPGPQAGRLKDPLLHTIGLARALGARFGDPAPLMNAYYFMGQRPGSAPSVFNYYALLARLPGRPEIAGPEYQLFSPSYAVYRADFIHLLVNNSHAPAIQVDITPFLAEAASPPALVALVDRTLLHGRMSAATRAALERGVAAATDTRQRAITALYLAALTADYTVYR